MNIASRVRRFCFPSCTESRLCRAGGPYGDCALFAHCFVNFWQARVAPEKPETPTGLLALIIYTGEYQKARYGK